MPLINENFEEFINEGKSKPKTKKQKDAKFGKVMKEFGKGQLKPYHASSNLKNKKQGGSKKEHKQALAIAFSEAGMTKESLNANEIPTGQRYAISFLTSKGFKLISSPLQLNRGNLIFKDPIGNMWGIFKNGGYIRKQAPENDRWAVVYRISTADEVQLNDDQYMDLSEIIATKYNDLQLKNKKHEERFGVPSGVSKDPLIKETKDGYKFKLVLVSKQTMKAAINFLAKDGFKNFNISAYEDNNERFPMHFIMVSAYKNENNLNVRKTISFKRRTGNTFAPQGINVIEIEQTFNNSNINILMDDTQINTFL